MLEDLSQPAKNALLEREGLGIGPVCLRLVFEAFIKSGLSASSHKISLSPGKLTVLSLSVAETFSRPLTKTAAKD
jgi:hypothetical protein